MILLYKMGFSFGRNRRLSHLFQITPVTVKTMFLLIFTQQIFQYQKTISLKKMMWEKEVPNIKFI